MTEKAVFHQPGCSVCGDAERRFAGALDRQTYAVEVVHLAESRERIAEARRAGVKSGPAFVMDGAVYHINHGVDLSALG